jgi:hypothetical protein
MNTMAATVVALLKKVDAPVASEQGLAGAAAEGRAHVGTFAGLEQHNHDQGDAHNHMNNYSTRWTLVIVFYSSVNR